MASVIGKLVGINEQSYSGVKVDVGGLACWFNGAPGLIQTAMQTIKRGDLVRVTLKDEGGKRLINLQKISEDAVTAVNTDAAGFQVKIKDNDGNTIYPQPKISFDKDDSIIRQVAAKCATELSIGKDVASWDAWANYIYKWIKGAL